MKFKHWLDINEMASFSLTTHLIIPCKSLETSIKLPCIDKFIGAIDMRFEDPGAYSYPYNKLTNGSRFAIPIPKSNNFLIYHGNLKKPTVLMGKQDAIEQKVVPVKDNDLDLTPGAVSDNGYYLIPGNWFTHAQIFDRNYKIIKPALADANGMRALKLSQE